MKNVIKIVIVAGALVGLTACGGGGGGTAGEETNSGGTTTGAGTTNGGTSTEGNTTAEIDLNAVIHNVSNVSEFRKALEDASLNGENDKIILAAGTYKTTEDSLGVFKFNDDEAYILSIVGDETVNKSKIILDGGKKNRILSLINKTSKSKIFLKNITVKNGLSTYTHKGAIVSFASAYAKVTNVDIVDNNDSAGYIVEGVHEIDNVLIDNNYANVGIIIRGDIHKGRTNIYNSRITNNKIKGHNGELCIVANIIKGSTIANNSFGGSDRYSSFILANKMEDSNITDNNSSKNLLEINSITRSLIKSNRDRYHLFTSSTNNATIYNSEISSNVSYYGISVDKLVGNSIKDNTIRNRLLFCDTAINNYIFNNRTNSNDSSTTLANIENSINNTFYKNSNLGHIAEGRNFVNTIFADNDVTSDLKIRQGYLVNSYIDPYKIESQDVIEKNNIFSSSSNLIFNDNATLKSNSIVINKGLNPDSVLFKKILNSITVREDGQNIILNALEKDLLGNTRVHNGVIDIGAVENTQ